MSKTTFVTGENTVLTIHLTSKCLFLILNLSSSPEKKKKKTHSGATTQEFLQNNI